MEEQAGASSCPRPQLMIHSALRAAAHTLYTRSLSHSLIFNSLSQREAVSGKLLGNALRKLHPNPESAGSRTLLGAVQRAAPPRPGWGPVSGHPQGGEERQDPDFRRGGGGGRWHRPQGHLLSPPHSGQGRYPGDPDLGKDMCWQIVSEYGCGVSGVFPPMSPHALDGLTSRPPTPGRPRRADTSPLPRTTAQAGAPGARAAPRR